MEVERARDLCKEIARASDGGKACAEEEEEEQKGEKRSGRQGVGRKRVKNNMCEGLSKRNRVTVRLCGGASQECIGGCDRGG